MGRKTGRGNDIGGRGRLMILRRVVAHFRKQEWTAIAIDLVIVVAGVFIGLQVANWNTARQARADERVFIQRLHDDVVQAEAKSARLRERRFTQSKAIIEGMAVIFGERERKDLSEEECLYLAFSHDYVLTAPAIPAFDELLSSGRLNIVRDRELKRSLARFQQSLEVLSYWRSWGTREQHTLPDKYPALIKVRSYFDEGRGEVWSQAICDAEGMRENQRFLNNLSENADSFDGFVRDALAPWNDSLSELHRRLDEILAIDHGTTP